MPLGLSSIRSHAMRAAEAAADAVHGVYAVNREALAGVGQAAFRAGAITAAGLPLLVRVIARYWRPARRGAPWKGGLIIPTALGGQRVTREDLPQFFAVSGPPAALAESGRTIQRFLQVYGAAHLAGDGRPERVTPLLQALLGACPALTASGMLAMARGTREDPGPAWAACLRRQERPAKAARRWVRRVRAEVALTGRSEEAIAEEAGRPAASCLAHVSAAELEGLQAEVGMALARARQREAVRRLAVPAPGIRPRLGAYAEAPGAPTPAAR